MDAIDALRSKRDTRSYTGEAVADEVLDRVFDAARMAGSAKNGQPVRIVTVTDSDVKVALKAGGDFASWIDQAPVLAVMTVRADAGPRRYFDVGRHAQNLMVAAHAEGLASCPVTFHHQDVVRPILGLPDDIEAPIVITLGLPGPSEGASPIAGPRMPLGDYVLHGTWA
jgi:nitroreductase